MSRRGDSFELSAAEQVWQAASEAGLSPDAYIRHKAEQARFDAALRDLARSMPLQTVVRTPDLDGPDIVSALKAQVRLPSAEEPYHTSPEGMKAAERAKTLEGIVEAIGALPVITDEERDPARPAPFAEVGQVALTSPDLDEPVDRSWLHTLQAIQELPQFPTEM